MDYAGLLVGLGNPGRQYEGTRHNMGFAAVDAILEESSRSGRVESLSGAKFKCELWRCTLPGSEQWWLAAKPRTFMNLSGESVQPLLAWHRIPPTALVVIHDELDLKPGWLRFKTGGGNAGHNGLKSITRHLGTPEFHRIRIGIGRPPMQGDVTGWVLGRPEPEAAALLRDTLAAVVRTVYLFAEQDAAAAVQYANSVRPGASSPA